MRKLKRGIEKRGKPASRTAPSTPKMAAKPAAKRPQAAARKQTATAKPAAKAKTAKTADTLKTLKTLKTKPKAATKAKAHLPRSKPLAATSSAITVPPKTHKAAAGMNGSSAGHGAAARSRTAPSPAAKGNGAAPAGQLTKKARAKLSSIVLPANYRPSDDEPFMGGHQRLYFRNRLLQWKEDIVTQNRATLQILHDDTLQHADLADRATSETDRALDLRARDRQRKLVNKIDAALARIEDGSYGYCEETGEPISLKRLDARPIATLSLEAQERHERRERVYRAD